MGSIRPQLKTPELISESLATQKCAGLFVVLTTLQSQATKRLSMGNSDSSSLHCWAQSA